MSLELSVWSFNTHGLRKQDKRERIFEYFKEKSGDKLSIIGLQETHSTISDEFEWKRQWGANLGLWNHYQYRKNGVAILFLNLPNTAQVDVRKDTEGRIIKATVEIEKNVYEIVNIYAPTLKKHRKKFYNTFQKNDWFSNDYNSYKILLGDFNEIVDPEFDQNDNTTDVNNTGGLRNIIKKYKLLDNFRSIHPDKRMYTCFNRYYKTYRRLDYIFTNKLLSTRLCEGEIIPTGISDHSMVVSKFCKDQMRSKFTKTWKFNNGILKDMEYATLIKNFINNCPEESWEKFKLHLIEFVKSLSRIRYYSGKKERLKLEKELSLEKVKTEPSAEKLAEISAELEKYYRQDYEGVKVRSRLQILDEGECSLKLLKALEKSNGRGKIMQALKDEDGILKTEINEIKCAARNFYSKLYHKSENLSDTAQNEILELIESRISTESKRKLEKEIRMSEISASLKSMANDKSPGPDGLTTEFYKFFWIDLKPKLYAAIQEIYEERKLTKSQREAHTTLLYKKGDPTDLSNWRPISLLNIDYKIISKTLSNRLKAVMPEIIAIEQTCSVQGRSIFTNIMLTKLTIEHADRNQNGLGIISLDQEKAFDRVDPAFLLKILKKFDFPEYFTSWIEILYTDIQTAVKINGEVTDSIKISRGLRQGCGMSPLLYVIVAEMLAQLIRKNPQITGYSVPGCQEGLKISQYADDTCIFVSTRESIPQVFKTINLYESASGAKLNIQKTKGFKAGLWKDMDINEGGIHWSADGFKLLGVEVGSNRNRTNQIIEIVEKIKTKCKFWSNLNLTIWGRATIANTFILSKLWYLLQIQDIELFHMKKIKNIIHSFLCKESKINMIKYSILTEKQEFGGVSLQDVLTKQKSFKIQWVNKFVNGADSKEKWRFFVLDLAPKNRHGTLEKLNYLIKHYKSVREKFWNSVLKICKQEMITVQQDLTVTMHAKQQDIANKSSKYIYHQLLDQNVRHAFQKVVRWSEICDIEISENEIARVFSSLKNKCFLNKIKEVQYKILVRSLVSKEKRANILRNVIREPCSRCKAKLETYEHMFFECSEVNSFWKKTKKDIFDKITQIDLSFKLILFGFSGDSLEKRALNFILYLGNFIVWQTRCNITFQKSGKGINVWREFVNALRVKLTLGVHSKVYSKFWNTVRKLSNHLFEK